MSQVKRLYEDLKPKSYDLNLDIDDEGMLFTGSVTIGAINSSKTNKITLHSSGLAVTDARILSSGSSVDVISVELVEKSDELIVHLGRELTANSKLEIHLGFSGKITKTLHGLYPCYFKDGTKTKHLLATQFESHHAREVFPCIDEPEAKAVFDLTLNVNAKLKALSNMPVKTTHLVGTKKTWKFETSPVMSSYLLAFVIGDVDCLSGTAKNGTQINIWATPNNVKHLAFALDVTVKCLDYYNEYFEIPYPLPKCDLVALPDFASGAMENWGLITFREAALLVDYKNTSLPTKQHVAIVIAHELAHQWFGNLVTMKWWDDLWLNEGFASWIEYLAVDHLFPDWQMWSQFITDNFFPAQSLDALKNTHPIQVDINDPDEIRSIFDSISYNKGASVIRMLHDFLGADNFRQGLIHYLNKYQYTNASTGDLWSALEFVSKKPVKNFMSAWTSLPGFPVITLQNTKDGLNLAQKRYFINSSSHEKAKEQVWPISVQSDTSESFYLEKSADTWKVPGADGLKLNHKQSGFYMVAYEDEHLSKLKQKILSKQITPEDRLGIINDIFQLTKAGIGHVSTDEALDFLGNFSQEDNALVWDVVAIQLSSLRRVMDDNSTIEALRPFTYKLAKKQFERLGWNEKNTDSHFDKLLRPTILSLMCSTRSEEILTEVRLRFEAMNKPEDIHPDIRSIIYSTNARIGDEKTYEKLLHFYQTTDSAEERINLACGLTSFEDASLINRSLEYMKSKGVRLQDVPYWLGYSLMNRKAKNLAYTWVKNNWQWLADNFSKDMFFPSIPKYIGSAFSDRAKLEEVRAFFETIATPGTQRSIDQALESIQWQSAWKERDHKKVLKFLRKSVTQ